jgi:1-aminocyclopropane-1-carboxylate deaminase
MDQVRVLRLDLLGGAAPGNKWFKLQPYLALARERGIRTLVSFGGAWSNHLHALAAVGREEGMRTVGIVRGERSATLSPTLRDVVDLGMQLVFVSRAAYRRRHEAAYLQALQARYAPCLVIPEGGAEGSGVLGCRAIGDLLQRHAPAGADVFLAVGTGTTLAGIAASVSAVRAVEGVAVLKGLQDIDDRVAAWLAQTTGGAQCRWRIYHGGHCGGYARVTPELQRFMLAFERSQGIPLDPVYTGKVFFTLQRRIRAGEIDPGQVLVAVHTGGLQGRRGYPWLAPPDDGPQVGAPAAD